MCQFLFQFRVSHIYIVLDPQQHSLKPRYIYTSFSTNGLVGFVLHYKQLPSCMSEVSSKFDFIFL